MGHGEGAGPPHHRLTGSGRSDPPIAKLKVQGADNAGACVFMHQADGCGVHADRPAACRHYPLGFDWMKNVFFNEPTIALREDVLRQAIAQKREDVGGG